MFGKYSIRQIVHVNIKHAKLLLQSGMNHLGYFAKKTPFLVEFVTLEYQLCVLSNVFPWQRIGNDLSFV